MFKETEEKHTGSRQYNTVFDRYLLSLNSSPIDELGEEERGEKGGGEREQKLATTSFNAQSDCMFSQSNTHQPWKTPYETPNAHGHPNAADQYCLKSNLKYIKIIIIFLFFFFFSGLDFYGCIKLINYIRKMVIFL